MKSAINEIIAREFEFPCLMQAYAEDGGEVIVLFYKKGEGTTVYSTDSTRKLGRYDNDWSFSEFSPYTGKITLEND